MGFQDIGPRATDDARPRAKRSDLKKLTKIIRELIKTRIKARTERLSFEVLHQLPMQTKPPNKDQKYDESHEYCQPELFKEEMWVWASFPTSYPNFESGWDGGILTQPMRVPRKSQVTVTAACTSRLGFPVAIVA